MNDSPEIPRLLPLQDSAMDWMKNSWSSGLSLARNVAISSEWLAWNVFAMTGESSKERLQGHDPKYGGLPRADNVAEIAAELSRRFSGKYLIVELALASPGDPWLSEVGAETVTCGDEVYQLVKISSDLALIEAFLTMADPAGIYNAFIMTSSIEIHSCPGILLQEGKISLCAAIAGAYDGEGYMFATVVTPLTGCRRQRRTKGTETDAKLLTQIALGAAAVALTVVNVAQLGADPFTDAAEGVDVGALAADAGAEGAEDLGADAAGDTAEADADTGDGCLTGGESFTPGTKVLLAGGSAVPISRLKAGEKVLATSTATGVTRAESITAVLAHHDSDLYDLRVRAGNRTAVIGTTRNHLFWDATAQRWVKAAALKYGSHLLTPSGGYATAAGGYTPERTSGWMWDLTVPGGNDHDFYIYTAAAPVLVHNCLVGEGGTQVTSRVLMQNEDYHIDVENPSPGVRAGQLHLQDYVGNKYQYNFETGEFEGLPRSLAKQVASNPAVARGIATGLRYLGMTP